MKKILLMLLVFVFAFVVVGCDKKKDVVGDTSPRNSDDTQDNRTPEQKLYDEIMGKVSQGGTLSNDEYMIVVEVSNISQGLILGGIGNAGGTLYADIFKIPSTFSPKQTNSPRVAFVYWVPRTLIDSSRQYSIDVKLYIARRDGSKELFPMSTVWQEVSIKNRQSVQTQFVSSVEDNHNGEYRYTITNRPRHPELNTSLESFTFEYSGLQLWFTIEMAQELNRYEE